MDWRTSSHSAENGNCIEVASADTVMIHNSRDRIGVTLTMPAETWRAFAAQARRKQPAAL